MACYQVEGLQGVDFISNKIKKDELGQLGLPHYADRFYERPAGRDEEDATDPGLQVTAQIVGRACQASTP